MAKRVESTQRATVVDLHRAAEELRALAEMEQDVGHRLSQRRAAAYLEREVDRRTAKSGPAEDGKPGAKPDPDVSEAADGG